MKNTRYHWSSNDEEIIDGGLCITGSYGFWAGGVCQSGSSKEHSTEGK